MLWAGDEDLCLTTLTSMCSICLCIHQPSLTKTRSAKKDYWIRSDSYTTSINPVTLLCIFVFCPFISINRSGIFEWYNVISVRQI